MLAAIIDTSQDAIVSKTLDGVIRTWNGAAERLFGYPAAEAVGQSIMLIIPPDRQHEERDILARLKRGERIEHYETVRVTKSGRLLDISLTISPLRDGAGRLVGASKIARDITERRRSEAALRASELRFSAFLKSLPGLAWLKDAQGRYLYANEPAAVALGRRPVDVVGRTDAELLPPQVAARTAAADARAVAMGQAVQAVETFGAPGQERHYVVSRFAVPDIDGAGTYIGGSGFDVTARLVAEEALRQSNRRKDEFLAMLAHELRNPLAPIRNGLHLLRLPGAADDSRRIIEMLERQVGQLVRLVDDLLEVSRISLGKIELKKAPVLLRTVIDLALETSSPLLAARGHRLHLELPLTAEQVDADAARLAQVFSNLLNNAAKYTPDGGDVTISARVEGGAVVVAVRDTGSGIPKEMLGRVFDMFMQVRDGHGGSRDGLGIGLSLVKSLVAMHGGSVEAHSEGRGKGSEFVVRLPRHDPGAADAPAAAPGRAVGGLPAAAHRILVADDNKDGADSLGMMLRFLGAAVEIVYDGADAVAAVSAFRPTIVLMDLGMPGMDGLEAARRIRAAPGGESPLLVALTGWGQAEDRERSRAAGFDHHLVKPVDLTKLQELFVR